MSSSAPSTCSNHKKQTPKEKLEHIYHLMVHRRDPGTARTSSAGNSLIQSLSAQYDLRKIVRGIQATVDRLNTTDQAIKELQSMVDTYAFLFDPIGDRVTRERMIYLLRSSDRQLGDYEGYLGVQHEQIQRMFTTYHDADKQYKWMERGLLECFELYNHTKDLLDEATADVARLSELVKRIFAISCLQIGSEVLTAVDELQKPDPERA